MTRTTTTKTTKTLKNQNAEDKQRKTNIHSVFTLGVCGREAWQVELGSQMVRDIGICLLFLAAEMKHCKGRTMVRSSRERCGAARVTRCLLERDGELAVGWERVSHMSLWSVLRGCHCGALRKTRG